jgi:hypothetical protein
VRTVIVDGETLVDNGRYLRLNEEELLEKFKPRANRSGKACPNGTGRGRVLMR